MASGIKSAKGKKLAGAFFKADGTFYGFRRMIGGRVFYFGSDYDAGEQTAAAFRRFKTAGDVIAGFYERTYGKTPNLWKSDNLTPEREADVATATALALAAVGKSPAAPATSPASPAASHADARPAPAAFVTSVPTAASGSAAATSTLSVHGAIDLFLAEQWQRFEEKKITEHTYHAVATRLRAVRRAFPDCPLSAVTRDVLQAAVGYWRKRPATYKGKPVGVQTVIGNVAAMGMLFRWAYNTERWDAFRAWEQTFKIKGDELRTPTEKRAAKSNPDQFTIDELTTLYAAATDRTRLFMLLALNCGMGQNEVATLRKWDLNLDATPPFIDRERTKTGVQGRYDLWKDTASLLAHYTSKYPSTRATVERGSYGTEFKPSIAERFTIGKKPAVAAEIKGDIEDVGSLALRTDDGYPLIHRSGAKRMRTDAIGLVWRHLYETIQRAEKREAKKAAKAGKESPATLRRLGYYSLRRTAAQMIRETAGHETAKVFLAHATLEASGRKSVSEAHYTKRTAGDFARVADALAAMRKTLQPMFDAATKADKTRVETDTTALRDRLRKAREAKAAKGAAA